MNRTLVDRVANAVLYEGYVLYPYRPSMKNRQRWTFGGLHPEAFCRAGSGDSSFCRTECLVAGDAGTAVEVIVRFLHLIVRQVGRISNPTIEPVESPPPGDPALHTWQEAEEREIEIAELQLGSLASRPEIRRFSFPGRQWTESIASSGVLFFREQWPLEGEVAISSERAGEQLHRLAVTVRNTTAGGDSADRDTALARTLLSTQILLGARHGKFISLLDPPDDCRVAAEACRNVRVWPVLIGEAGQSDIMLASPIILYDYPQIACESPGDLFEGTEIDEILSLRILTLTDEEKRLAASLDERTRGLLARTESLESQNLSALHGVLRSGGSVDG